jgi:hypothetical protein
MNSCVLTLRGPYYFYIRHSTIFYAKKIVLHFGLEHDSHSVKINLEEDLL